MKRTVSAINELVRSLEAISRSYEDCNLSKHDEFYPFHLSLDELLLEVMNWRDAIIEKRTIEEMEQIETTDNNGRIDVGFKLDGIRYLARSVDWSEADLDETSQDFKSEFYQKILDSRLFEKAL